MSRGTKIEAASNSKSSTTAPQDESPAAGVMEIVKIMKCFEERFDAMESRFEEMKAGVRQRLDGLQLEIQ